MLRITVTEEIGSSSIQQGIDIFGSNSEELLRYFVNIITFGIDIAAGIIIGVSSIFALASFFRILRKTTKAQTHEKETIRLRLARGLLLALDFEIGSDILKTVLVPGVNELMILAVIVGIRIILTWSLSKEIGRHKDDLTDSANISPTQKK
jgi:uncharacterized membrane protein